MKKFLFQFLLFLLVPFSLMFIMELLIHRFHNDLFSENNLENLFFEEIADYEWFNTLDTDSLIVLAGSSSVKYSLSCTQLNDLSHDSLKYINLAEDARDPIATYFILKNLDLSHVNTLFFGLDPWIYSRKYYLHRNDYMYLDLNLLQALKFTFEYDGYALFTRYKHFFMQFLKSEPTDFKKNNTIPKDFGSETLHKIPKNFNEKPLNLFKIEKYGWSDLQFIYLKKISELCNKKGIHFYFFLPPKRSDFIRSYKAECAQIHQEFVQNLNKNNVKTQIYGKFDQLMHEGDSLNFVDPFHLNERGQKRYSEIFYQLTQTSNQPYQNQYSWYKN